MGTRLFSIIVPIYNIQKYIKRCIDSILEQSVLDFELILIDDGSTDLSGGICDEYVLLDSRIKVYHKDNGGLSDARNLGIQKATGLYTIFVDGDDFWENSKYLERLYKYLDTKPDVVMSMFKRCCEDETKIWIKYGLFDESRVNKMPYGQSIQYMVTHDLFIVSACSKIIKTNLLKEKEIFFERGLIHEDIDWTLKLITYASSIVYTNESGYIYRVREGSITRCINEKSCFDLWKIISKWSKYYKEKDNTILGKAMLSFLSYEYYIFLGMLTILKCEEKYNYMELSWIIKYSRSKKSIACKYVYRVLGNHYGKLFLGYIVRNK